nr:hypothetical protein [Tanacetum cinerariifolium]
MSDNIQMEIIKKVSDVKSLIRFRSVSKPWKSFIDSSEFIKGYGSRHTQPHSHILSFKCDYSPNDFETFKIWRSKWEENQKDKDMSKPENQVQMKPFIEE